MTEQAKRKADIDAARRYSLWLCRQLDSGKLDAARLAAWLERPLTVADFQKFADWAALGAAEDEDGLAAALRVLRRYVMAHIMVRDLCRVSDLAEVTRTITEFADFAVNTALDFAHRYYVGLYGQPVGAYSRAPQHLSVVAMGKAGGFELNVSSDIDLIFVYPESGYTDGRRERSNQEFFTKVGQKLIALLDEIGAEGQVFRVDMRLRPDGDSGALVLSETALEQYLVTQGREWERYAWCKGRVVTPYANDVNALVRPFVFRKYLDYRAYEAMRGLHSQIRQEVRKRGMADNIKLGAGGIREVEFIAQIFQMIRGGQNRALQLKGTQETLRKLAELAVLPPETCERLLSAYRFLRDTEHRLQYWDDQQTQTLPDDAVQQQRLAESMGFADWAEFFAALQAHRDEVNRVFTDILGTPEDEHDAPEHPLAVLWQDIDDSETAVRTLNGLGFDGQRAAARLQGMKNSSRYRQLSAQVQPRFDAAVPRLIEAAAACAQADHALMRLLDFVETVCRRSAYLVFLQQYPHALQQLAELVSQSSWLAAYLNRHPILLDELLSAQLSQRTDWQAFKRDLAAALEACDDTESKMDVLRHHQHAQTFRLAVQDLAGMWSVEALSDELSLLADIVLAQTLQHAWRDMPKTHRAEPAFAVIAYGKLGGKELGYVSDLDLVYLYYDDHPDAADNYTKLARRLNTWLSGNTGAGTLYELDLRLRPNGEAGFLAHSLAAFRQYQEQNAWTWEHQALTRARFICGDAALGDAFEALRREILMRERDDTLKQDVLAMREKMFPTHPPIDEDVKYARGGVVDVEFIVQYLVLAHSRSCPELLENYGNIALLDMAAKRGLIAETAAEAGKTAYRRYRKIQHAKKLRDLARAPVDEELRASYDAVKALWGQVFGERIL